MVLELSDCFLSRLYFHAILFQQMNELSEAEDALAEANILNNTDPEVWAYLSLVCLRTNRQLEAEQSFKYAVKVCAVLTHAVKGMLGILFLIITTGQV